MHRWLIPSLSGRDNPKYTSPVVLELAHRVAVSAFQLGRQQSIAQDFKSFVNEIEA
jgi:hypothetical protein